jgi:glucose-6-phosphate-specific signal transduction histidine kinase
MATNNQSVTERISERLDAFNQRLAARLRRNQKLLENMRAEEDFRKSMGYLKEFFRFKGGK